MLTPEQLKNDPAYKAWIGRMYNWKFNSALSVLPEDADEDIRQYTEAFARVFGNTGWMFGDMGEIVRLAVGCVAGFDDEEE